MKNFISKKRVKNLVAIVVVAITFYFFGRTILRNWDEVKEIGFRFDLDILSSLILFSIAVLISGVLWGQVVNRLITNDVRLVEFSKIHISSWLLKYIPGQVGSFLRKITWGQTKDISKKVITTSFLYENLFLIISSLLLSIPIILVVFLEDILNNLSMFIPLLLTVPLLLLLNKKVLYFLLNNGLKLIGKKVIPDDLLLTNGQIFTFLLKYFLPRLVNGLAFVAICNSIIGVTGSEMLPLIAIYTLAGIVGLLAIFVPSGVGVREGIIVLFLSNYTGVTEAVVISIYSRFLTTISDLILLGIYLILDRFVK